MATEEEHREEWIGLYEVTSADWDGAGADFGLYSPKCLEGVFSGGVCFGLVLLIFIVVDFTDIFLLFGTPLREPRELILSWAIYDDIFYVAAFALFLVPVFTYIAILRYRLYEIDIIINRTLVYAILSAALAAVYFGGVTATEAIFRTLTGQEEQPQLAIVVTTLVITALFNPLRRRIQSFIDRRFYRRKYDAAKTLEAFSAKLRDETDLDALSDDLVGVVRETMQPAHVSLWLRPDTGPKKGE
jgi:hypothetical protein